MGLLRDVFIMKGDGIPAIKSASTGDMGWLFSDFGWSSTLPNGTGQVISEKSALAIATNWNCQNGISSDCAQLPFKMLKYGTNAAGLETRTTIQNDPIAKIFTRMFNPRMTAYAGRQMMKRWKLGTGNAYAEIVRDGTDTPACLYPIHPSRVPPDAAKKKKDTSEQVIRLAHAEDAPADDLIFKVNNNDGTSSYITERDMFWLKGPSDDGYFGLPSVALMQNSLGLDSAVSRFLKHFYENGARPGMILTTEQVIPKPQKEELKRQWAEAYSGPTNAGKTVVTDRGLTPTAFQQTFEAMELTDLRRLSRTDIAGFYRFPLSKLMIEGIAQGWDVTHAQEASYVNDCLLNHVIPWEQEIERQMMREYGSFAGYADDIAPHFETKGRMRGDDKSRAAYLQFRFNVGSISPNEIKELEDESPSDDPNMNKTFIQMGFVPLDMVSSLAQAQVDASKQNPETAGKQDAKALLEFEAASRLGKRIANGSH